MIGGIVPVVNMPASPPGKLKLTGPLLADIYAGKVKNWNDPAIAAINPGVNAARRRDRRRPPLGRLGHDLQLHPLSQPGQPDLEDRRRRRQTVAMAGRRRRQGQ